MEHSPADSGWNPDSAAAGQGLPGKPRLSQISALPKPCWSQAPTWGRNCSTSLCYGTFSSRFNPQFIEQGIEGNGTNPCGNKPESHCRSGTPEPNPSWSCSLFIHSGLSIQIEFCIWNTKLCLIWDKFTALIFRPHSMWTCQMRFLNTHPGRWKYQQELTQRDVTLVDLTYCVPLVLYQLSAEAGCMICWTKLGKGWFENKKNRAEEELGVPY